MKKLPSFLKQRKNNAKILTELLQNCDIVLPKQRKHETLNWYLYTIAHKNRNKIMKKLSIYTLLLLLFAACTPKTGEKITDTDLKDKSEGMEEAIKKAQEIKPDVITYSKEYEHILMREYIKFVKNNPAPVRDVFNFWRAERHHRPGEEPRLHLQGRSR